MLSHTDCQHENGDRQDSEFEANRERDNSRRAVGDFIGVCLEEKVDVPVSDRDNWPRCWKCCAHNLIGDWMGI